MFKVISESLQDFIPLTFLHCMTIILYVMKILDLDFLICDLKKKNCNLLIIIRSSV